VEVVQLKPNRYGRFRKEDVLENGFEIVTYGVTATEIEKEVGVKLTMQQRLKHCLGFRCEKSWRGCVPVFDTLDIALKHDRGEL